jgi:hypothetical protein
MAWVFRIVFFGIFLALMAGYREVVHAVVDAGPIAWLLLMGGIFWIGLAIENAGRRAERRPLYSWHEAREIVIPVGYLAIIWIIWVLRDYVH